MLFFSFAFRNIFRHRTRLFLNLILLVSSICVIICLNGFKNHVLETIQKISTNAKYGNLQIAQKKYWDNSPTEILTEKMITHPDELIQKISKMENVDFASSRIGFVGLLNTEDSSATAYFIGVDPRVESEMQNNFSITSGSSFSKEKESIISTDLKNKLKTTPPFEATIVSPNVSGTMNAMDIQINGVFGTGFPDIDSGTVFIHLKDAQKLMDTSYVDQIIVKTKNLEDEMEVFKKIQFILKDSELQVKTWKELADLYRQVEDFYTFQNLFFEIIIVLLLAMSITNTVSLTAFERISEIGTLRALGDTQLDIQKIFMLESLLLGLFAIFISIPASLFIIKFISSLNMNIDLPMSSQPVSLRISPTIGVYFEASMICLSAIVLATIWPAYKSSKVQLVSALLAKI